MSAQKRYRQGQILKLIASGVIANQDELRRRLAQLKLRATQATLSRDLRELKLVKTPEGYKQLSGTAEEAAPVPAPLQALARALREFLLDIRPAENLLVLKTPPGGAQPLAAALDAEHSAEIAGTIAGDDTILVVTPTRKTREALQKKIEELVQ
jgi:transcriptional regulator of arginine metabolism